MNKKKILLITAVVAVAALLIKNPYYDAAHDDKVQAEKTVEKTREATVILHEAYEDNSIYLTGIDAQYDIARTHYAHAIALVSELDEGKRKNELKRQLKTPAKEIEGTNLFNKAVRAGKRLSVAKQKVEKEVLQENVDTKKVVSAQKELEGSIEKLTSPFLEVPFPYAKRDLKKMYLNPAIQMNRDATVFMEIIALNDEAKNAEKNNLPSEAEKFRQEAMKKIDRIKHEELKSRATDVLKTKQ